MNDELKRYPYVDNQVDLRALKVGVALGVIIGLGVGLIVFALSAWCFS